MKKIKWEGKLTEELPSPPNSTANAGTCWGLTFISDYSLNASAKYILFYGKKVIDP